MPYTFQSTADAIAEISANAIDVYWYGTLGVGTYLYPTNAGSGINDGLEAETDGTAVTWIQHPGGSWVNIDGTDYHDTREGWIKFKDNLGVVMSARVKQGQEVCAGGTVLEILELIIPSVDYEAELGWTNNVTPVFLFQNQPRIIINSQTHFLSPGANPIIDIPNSGIVNFEFKHLIRQQDLDLTVDGSITMSAEIKDGGIIRINPVSYTTSTSTDNTELSLFAGLDMSNINNQQVTVRLITDAVAIE